MNFKALGILILLLLLATGLLRLLTSSPVSPPAQVTTAAAAKAVATPEAGPWAITVHSSERRPQVSRYDPPKPGWTYLLVDVTVEYRGAKPEQVTPAWFQLRDAEGRQYDHATFLDPQSLGLVAVQPGDKARGWIAFHVPEASQGLTLVWNGKGYLAGPQIRLPLE